MRSAAIQALLPAQFQRAARPGSVLDALLSVMEGMHEPTERQLAAVAELFSPYRSPPELVPFLAGWVGMAYVAGAPRRQGESPLPMGRWRNLLSEAATIAQWRGTAAGLRKMLETATGVPGFVVAEPADRPFHIIVHTPDDARSQIALIRYIVDAEKPAAVTCDVVADDDSSEHREGMG